MQCHVLVNNLLIHLHIAVILFILWVYFWDYRKLRIRKDFTGIYVSFKVWEYSHMWDQYNPKTKRIYLWRPSKY